MSETITQEIFKNKYKGKLENLTAHVQVMNKKTPIVSDEPKSVSVETIKLTLPYPPSANQMWRYAMGTVYSNKALKDYKKTVAGICKEQNIQPFGKKRQLVFIMKVFRKIKSGDLDNRIKILLDSLNKNAYYDDKQIVEIHAYRFDDALNPRVEIEITESRFG